LSFLIKIASALILVELRRDDSATLRRTEAEIDDGLVSKIEKAAFSIAGPPSPSKQHSNVPVESSGHANANVRSEAILTEENLFESQGR
jgi:hypothetical protein